MRKKLLFIVNPISGKGQIRSHLLDILDIFQKAEFAVTVHITQKALHAKEVVIQNGKEYDIIVCSGGDGTLNETVSGIKEANLDTPLGYIPAGSTNDFGASLGIPKDMKKAAQLIVRGNEFICDMGLFNQRYFNYVAAFGAFTEISYATPQQMKNVLGHQAYLLEAIKGLTAIKAVPMELTWENKRINGEFIYGMISNSTSVGGFKKIVGKSVQMDDGLFEVTLIRKPSSPLEVQDIMTALLKEDMNSENMITFKTSYLHIVSPEKVPWVLDGEFGGNPEKISVQNIPKALRVLC